MKALYVTSVEPFIGKTAVCVTLGLRLQSDGYKVGYLKPLSTQPWRTPDGRLTDEDAAFVCETLALGGDCTELTPVIITPASLRQRMTSGIAEDLIPKIQEAAKRAAMGKDVLLLEGGASLRQGYAVGLSNVRLAEILGAPVLLLVRYHSDTQLLDDLLASRARLGAKMFGAILNRVPAEASEFVEQYGRSFLEREGIQVVGVLPAVPRLSALSVGDLVRRLEADVLTKHFDPQALVETFTVGAMTIEAALSRFRRQQNKAVITGGDRTDIQLAALETSTVALILTGNLQPSALIVQQAEALGIPILLVKENTMETVNRIEKAYGKTRLAEPAKLEAFMKLMEERVDVKAIYAAVGLQPPS
jgi:BioD-like phosphotransacetylase family protein